MMKILGKGVTKAGRECNKIDHMDKNFDPGSSFK